MRTRALIATSAAVAAVALAALAWRHAVDARRAAAATAALQAERASLDARLADARQRLAASEAERAKRHAALERAQKMATAAAKASPPPRRPSLSITSLIRNEPDAQLLYLEAKRAELASRYGPLFRALGLTPAQAARFQEHAIQREAARMDLAEVAQNDPAAIEKLRSAAESTYEAGQRELLGPSGYAQLQDYERTSSTRAMVSAIAGVAALEGAPFSAEQAEQLVRAIANTSESYRRGRAVLHPELDWDAIDREARAILAPAQLAVFATMDPGPTRGGLLQTRMYALVTRANAAERAAAKTSAAP